MIIVDIIPPEIIEKRIFILRDQKVMLDFHLSELYGIETKTLKRAVRRNLDRFPMDFCFQLTDEELINLKVPTCSKSSPADPSVTHSAVNRNGRCLMEDGKWRKSVLNILT
ncbi:MAG: ORF6N domain-containing protein, partial [Bacteroidetes bacterium]|nr:ORF6N domain-containing protein [Bacteroidota bacterium]MBU2585831.1 ORF6N domain-containing protein [Bacteroidota bacterium]